MGVNAKTKATYKSLVLYKNYKEQVAIQDDSTLQENYTENKHNLKILTEKS